MRSGGTSELLAERHDSYKVWDAVAQNPGKSAAGNVHGSLEEKLEARRLRRELARGWCWAGLPHVIGRDLECILLRRSALCTYWGPSDAFGRRGRKKKPESPSASRPPRPPRSLSRLFSCVCSLTAFDLGICWSPEGRQLLSFAASLAASWSSRQRVDRRRSRSGRLACRQGPSKVDPLPLAHAAFSFGD